MGNCLFCVDPATSGLPPVLDVCCGSRAFWFDKGDNRAVFQDKRVGTYTLNRGVHRAPNFLEVKPDVLGDFTSMGFSDKTFSLVVFDPPHFVTLGRTSNSAKTYGILPKTGWQDIIRLGFQECFRVLRNEGTLIFKWNSFEIALQEVLALTPNKPLFGHKSGKHSKTHWVAFMKTG